jgi:hypothetical protein
VSSQKNEKIWDFFGEKKIHEMTETLKTKKEMAKKKEI